MKKTLDILKKYNFTGNVQNNIKILLKNFGSKFNIKYKNIYYLLKFQKILI